MEVPRQDDVVCLFQADRKLPVDASCHIQRRPGVAHLEIRLQRILFRAGQNIRIVMERDEQIGLMRLRKLRTRLQVLFQVELVSLIHGSVRNPRQISFGPGSSQHSPQVQAHTEIHIGFAQVVRPDRACELAPVAGIDHDAFSLQRGQINFGRQLSERKLAIVQRRAWRHVRPSRTGRKKNARTYAERYRAGESFDGGWFS